MTIIAIIISLFLEQQRLLVKPREFFAKWLTKYLSYFTNKSFKNQRTIRYAYLFSCLPVVAILLTIRILLISHPLLYLIVIVIIFMFSVQLLTWKKKAAEVYNSSNFEEFISMYATGFFAPLLWFVLLPVGVGAVCYLIITQISLELKDKGMDIIVYNVVVDKMLFYANVIPYFVLYVFIAIAGNFEIVFHHILDKRKSFDKSFYFLNNTLHEIILLAIDKDKFQIKQNEMDDTESGVVPTERFTPEIKSHIIAILYRAGIFFVGSLVVIMLVRTLGFIA